jgi:hypothetical protein
MTWAELRRSTAAGIRLWVLVLRGERVEAWSQSLPDRLELQLWLNGEAFYGRTFEPRETTALDHVASAVRAEFLEKGWHPE